MTGLQFTLGSLLAAVVLAGVGVAALCHADQIWQLAMLVGTGAILFIVTGLAIRRLGNARWFWAGFACGAWGYALLLVTPVALGRLAFLRSFPTTRLLQSVYAQFVGNATSRFSPPYGEEFVHIGHYLLTLFCGFLAGWVALALSGAGCCKSSRTPIANETCGTGMGSVPRDEQGGG